MPALLLKLRRRKPAIGVEIPSRTALGPALVAHRGWAHTEVSQYSLSPHGDFAQSLKKNYGLAPLPLPILNALSVHYMTAGQLRESLRWADRLSKTGARLGEDSLEVVGHRAASACHYWLGEFAAARHAGDQAQRLYDAERHWNLATLTNTDLLHRGRHSSRSFLWMMGYLRPGTAAASQAMEANAAA